MALNKINYVDNQTIITAQNLNNIQDCVIALQKNSRNLLDNSDFRNPVNQRGQTSYNLLQGNYGIDRWMPLNVTGVKNTVELTNNGIIFGNENNETVFLTQRFEKGYLDSTKIYTTVECFEDGTISFGGYIDFNSAMNCDIVNLTFPANTKIKWVALYEGEYTAETLPEYQPKGYSAELAECQRYYWESDTLGSAAFSQWHLHVPIYILPVEMRILYPSIKVVNPWTGTEGAVAKYTHDGFLDVIVDDISANSKTFSIASTGIFEKDENYRFKVILSADL